jgi:hypothetical protein
MRKSSEFTACNREISMSKKIKIVEQPRMLRKNLFIDPESGRCIKTDEMDKRKKKADNQQSTSHRGS